MKNNILTTKTIIKEMNLEIINFNQADINRQVKGANLNRVGLELAGQIKLSHKSGVIGWGSKESEWFEKIGNNNAIKAMKNVLSTTTPLILLSNNVSKKIVNLIIEQANLLRIPVCVTNYHLSDSISTLGFYLANYFAPSTTVHGCLVNVNGVGVAIIGEPGIGKSEAVLELIQNNHFFISDDVIILKRVGKEFWGFPSEITKDILEARGIGLIDIGLVYGQKVVKDSTKVDLIVELMTQENTCEFDRIGTKSLKYKVLNSWIPLVQIPVNKGRSMAVLIEAAANVLLAKQQGNNPIEKIKLQQDNQQKLNQKLTASI